MGEPALEEFLRRALVWPNPNEDTGWVNLHWRPHDAKGITGGQAFKTPSDVLSFVDWTQSRGKGKVADLYFCTSLQFNHGDVKQRTGKYCAERSADNAVSSKLLFADIDKYATKREMFIALQNFCAATLSPFPTALVDSGGGLHAYWILPEALQKEDWIQCAHKLDGLMNAHGLKHDNISTDIARILRVPGTFNFKRANLGNPPKPVVLKLLNGDIDLQTWKSLHEATPTPQLTYQLRANTAVSVEHYFVHPTEIKTGPAKAFIGRIPLADQLAEGTVETAPVLKLCPMFKETFATGGKEVQQPVWHQQALAATFFIDGRQFFHDLGRQHPGYSRETSDAMYDRKIRDRASKGLGYPSCAAFERDGASQCITCPMKGKVASPLNLTARLVRSLEDANRKVNPPAPADVLRVDGAAALPPWKLFIEDCLAKVGCHTNEEDGYIYFEQKAGKRTETVQLFSSKVLAKPTLIKDLSGDNTGLRLLVTGDGGKEDEPINVVVPPEAFCESGPKAIYESLARGGLVVRGHPAKVADVMVTFRGQLAEIEEAQRMVAYGWEYEDRKEGDIQGGAVGFAYAGTVYGPNGETRPTYGGDENITKIYFVTGNPSPWVSALRTVLRMQSPGLATIVLSAFAAPLMIFSGQPSTVVMVRGQSGGSKSTASAVACAVWACPRTAMLKPSSSKLGTMRRMSALRHMPTIWDDVRSEQFEKIKDTLMEITQGGEGIKLNQNRDERDQGIWDNMLLTTSNASLMEYLESISKNDGAALVRCFEFEVPKVVAGDPAYEDPSRLAALISTLDANHGHAGRQYATLLGADPKGLQAMYDDVVARITKRIHPFQPHERFWMAAVATILMGGMLANQLKLLTENGIKFNLFELENFLVTIYLDLRKRYSEANHHADTASFVSFHLQQFINQYAVEKNEIVWTQETPHGAGKPQASAPLSPIGDKLHNMKRVSVRFITTERKLRFTKAAVDRYLRQEKVSVDRFKEGAINFYKAEILPRCRIAAGLINISASAPEAVYEIGILRGTWLDTMLTQHSTPEDEIQETVQPLLEQIRNQ